MTPPPPHGPSNSAMPRATSPKLSPQASPVMPPRARRSSDAKLSPEAEASPARPTRDATKRKAAGSPGDSAAYDAPISPETSMASKRSRGRASTLTPSGNSEQDASPIAGTKVEGPMAKKTTSSSAASRKSFLGDGASKKSQRDEEVVSVRGVDGDTFGQGNEDEYSEGENEAAPPPRRQAPILMGAGGWFVRGVPGSGSGSGGGPIRGVEAGEEDPAGASEDADDDGGVKAKAVVEEVSLVVVSGVVQDAHAAQQSKMKRAKARSTTTPRPGAANFKRFRKNHVRPP